MMQIPFILRGKYIVLTRVNPGNGPKWEIEVTRRLKHAHGTSTSLNYRPNLWQALRYVWSQR